MARPAPTAAVPDALQSTCYLPLSAPAKSTQPRWQQVRGLSKHFVFGELAASRNPAARQSSDGYLLWVGWVAITGKLSFGEPRIGVAFLLIDRVT